LKFFKTIDFRDRKHAEKGTVAAYVKAAIPRPNVSNLNVEEITRRAESLAAESLCSGVYPNHEPEWRVRWKNHAAARLAVNGVISVSHALEKRAVEYAKPPGAGVIALEFAHRNQVHQIEILADLATLLANPLEGCGLSFEVLSMRSRSVDLPSDKCLPLGYFVGGIPANNSSIQSQGQQGESEPRI
jgi:hypothetical protein